MAGNADIGTIGWIDISVEDASGLKFRSMKRHRAQ